MLGRHGYLEAAAVAVAATAPSESRCPADFLAYGGPWPRLQRARRLRLPAEEKCPTPLWGGYRQTQFVGPSGIVLRRIDKLSSRDVPGMFFDALDKLTSRNVPGMFFSKSQVQELFWECSSFESSSSKIMFSERSSNL